MQKSYTVTQPFENSTEVQYSSEVNEEDPSSNSDPLQSFDDLPKLLRAAILVSPSRWKKSFVVLEVVVNLGFVVPIFTFATSSITIGVAASLYFATVSNMQVLAPDFTKGVFLKMLLNSSQNIFLKK